MTSPGQGCAGVAGWNFVRSPAVPEVKLGDYDCFVVLTLRDKTYATFAAYFLNGYPLNYDECKCDSEKDHADGDGCPTTGWFYDNSNFEYENCYYPIDGSSGTIIAWAPIPTPDIARKALADVREG